MDVEFRKNFNEGRKIQKGAVKFGDSYSTLQIAWCYEKGEFGFPLNQSKANRLRQLYDPDKRTQSDLFEFHGLIYSTE
jgi:hypothetical protein